MSTFEQYRAERKEKIQTLLEQAERAALEGRVEDLETIRQNYASTVYELGLKPDTQKFETLAETAKANASGLAA